MKYPVDIERAMDEFILRNPNAGWRAILAAFDKAMMQSMREGGWPRPRRSCRCRVDQTNDTGEMRS